ncbi:flagellar hook-length control protein FliK [Cryobacterium sp. CAN_C3]|uniref:flagellar hook-length control protein FliK n=1 Tax=unclassified Cryobacterium TaxID=2649013 RepID=UPI0018C91258|nr:flagellar hook-length control protein FliK [Cryobacterium sp. CAN_C3]MEC5153986.1 flagellar hook-length control protein FliK [Cryobacterium sp. CAN_C3]
MSLVLNQFKPAAPAHSAAHSAGAKASGAQSSGAQSSGAQSSGAQGFASIMQNSVDELSQATPAVAATTAANRAGAAQPVQMQTVSPAARQQGAVVSLANAVVSLANAVATVADESMIADDTAATDTASDGAAPTAAPVAAPTPAPVAPLASVAGFVPSWVQAGVNVAASTANTVSAETAAAVSSTASTSTSAAATAPAGATSVAVASAAPAATIPANPTIPASATTPADAASTPPAASTSALPTSSLPTSSQLTPSNPATTAPVSPAAPPTPTVALALPADTVKAGTTKLNAVRLVTADAAAPAVTPTLGALTPLSAVVSAAPVAPTAPVALMAQAAPVPLAAQVAKPIFSLANVGPGEHMMTISVTPDNLGPVTVRAHVSLEGIRVELFAPTELARDSLRAIMPDLRRDLAGSGLNAQLNLSNQNLASHNPASQDNPGNSAGSWQQGADRTARVGHEPDTPAEPLRPQRFGEDSTIDVMA